MKRDAVNIIHNRWPCQMSRKILWLPGVGCGRWRNVNERERSSSRHAECRSLECRIQNRSRVRAEQAADFVQSPRKFSSFSILEISSEDQIVVTLFHGCLRDVQEPALSARPRRRKPSAILAATIRQLVSSAMSGHMSPASENKRLKHKPRARIYEPSAKPLNRERSWRLAFP